MCGLRKALSPGHRVPSFTGRPRVPSIESRVVPGFEMEKSGIDSGFWFITTALCQFTSVQVSLVSLTLAAGWLCVFGVAVHSGSD